MAVKKKTSARSASKKLQKKKQKPAKKKLPQKKRKAAPKGRRSVSARASGLTVDAYLARLTPPQRNLCMRVLSLVADAAQDATLSIKWGQPVWERNGPFAYMRAHTAYVSLGFWRGAELDDDGGLLVGDGDKMRHIKLRPDGDFPIDAIRRLVHEAVARNALRGDPTRPRA